MPPFQAADCDLFWQYCHNTPQVRFLQIADIRRRTNGFQREFRQVDRLANRNRIRGILGRTSVPLLAKSSSIKGQGCRSGGDAARDGALVDARDPAPRLVRYVDGVELARQRLEQLAATPQHADRWCLTAPGQKPLRDRSCHCPSADPPAEERTRWGKLISDLNFRAQ